MFRSTMNVTSSGSTLRLRSSSAACPIDTRSRLVQQHERVLVADALALQRAVEDLGDRAGGGGDRHQETLSQVGDEAQRRHLVEGPRAVGELEEAREPRALPLAETVPELLEVPGQIPGRVAVPDGRGAGHVGRVLVRVGDRAGQRPVELVEARACRPGPPTRRTPSAGRCARATARRGRGAAAGRRTPTAAPRRRSSAGRRRPRPRAGSRRSGTACARARRDDADCPVTAIERTAGSGTSVTSCTDSTAPSEPTQSDGSSTYARVVARVLDARHVARRRLAARAAARSARVGTPTTSSARPSPRCRARLHASGKVLM